MDRILMSIPYIWEWWNDHDSGVRAWTKMKLAGNLSFVTTSTQGIVGTTTNDSAAAGNVGEYAEALATGVSFPATGNYGDMTSMSLTAGDWDAVAVSDWDVTGAHLITGISIGISVTSGNSSTGLIDGSNLIQMVPGSSATYSQFMALPSYRLSLAATTTVYLKYRATYTGTNGTVSGRLSARRVR